jgi:ribonuclease I
MSGDEYFAAAAELTRRFIALPAFHALVSANEGKRVTRAQILDALASDLGSGAARAVSLDCRREGHGGKQVISLAEVDLSLDRNDWMKFPAPESLETQAVGGTGDCPAQGITITPGRR